MTDLQDLSLLDTGQLYLDISLIEVQDVISNVVQSLMSEASHKNINIKLSVDEGPLQIQVDQQRLIQILKNLIENAIKYSPENSDIQVEVSEVSQMIQIAIVDSGEGIDEKQLDTIFERSYRISSKDNLSSGLGLSIVKKLSLAMNGDVKVKSISSKGSTFTVSFPSK